MKKGFSHQMEIQESDMPSQLICQRFEFTHCKFMLCPPSLRTKHTIKIAYIRYFKITSGNHKEENRNILISTKIMQIKS